MQKVSGAKTLFFKITNQGRNYLPLIEDIDARFIKYIDIVPCTSIPGTTDDVISPERSMSTISLSNKANILFIKDVPVGYYDPILRGGIRQPLMSKISLQKSYIDVSDPSEVGKYFVLVFWYDLPEYSARNKSDHTALDSVSMQVKNLANPVVFPDNRAMSGKRFRNIYLSVSEGVTPTGREVVPNTTYKEMFLSLYKGNYAVLDRVPLCLFDFYKQYKEINFANIVFDFVYSYVEFGGLTDSDNIGKDIYITLRYED